MSFLFFYIGFHRFLFLRKENFVKLFEMSLARSQVPKVWKPEMSAKLGLFPIWKSAMKSFSFAVSFVDFSLIPWHSGTVGLFNDNIEVFRSFYGILWREGWYHESDQVTSLLAKFILQKMDESVAPPWMFFTKWRKNGWKKTKCTRFLQTKLPGQSVERAGCRWQLSYEACSRWQALGSCKARLL